MKTVIPDSWQKYLSSQETNCVVFLNHWMNHARDYKGYDQQANQLEKELKLEEYLSKWEIKDYLQCETFKQFDLSIIDKLTKSLSLGSEEYDWFKKVISIRKTKHWYKYFQTKYQAISWAIELFCSG